MSAFSANSLRFGMRISATDDTRPGLRSSLSGIQSFTRSALKPITIPVNIARGGLSLLRDINLGLAPLVRGLDGIIERGGMLEVQRKTFRSLTKSSADDAERLATGIVKASSGALTMARSLQLANRLLSSGINYDQILTTAEFVTKYSAAIGRDAGVAMETITTGLARGSTLFLDDYGILVDGIEGVKRRFDEINGTNAFNALDPMAQKMQVINQAVNEMQERIVKIGVSGKEPLFVYQSLKNTIVDMVDNTALVISKTAALRDLLKGARDMLSGVNEHFKQGGSFAELLFGKGKSGGLFGIAKGALVDAGSAIGRGVLGSLAIGIGSMPWLGDKLKSAWDWAMERLRATLNAAWNDFKAGLGINDPLGPMKFFGGKTPKHSDLYNPDGSIKITRKQAEYGAQSAAHEAAMMSLPSPAKNRVPEPDFFERVLAFGRSLVSGGVLGGDSAFLAEAKATLAEFPGIYNQQGYEPAIQPMGRYRLTQGARDSRMRKIRAHEAKLRNIEAGGDFARQNALRESGEQIRDLLLKGYHLSPADRRELFEKALERQIKTRRDVVQPEIDNLYNEVNESDARRAHEADYTRMRTGLWPRRGQAAKRRAAEEDEAIRLIAAKIDQFLSGVSAILQKLTGEEIKLGNAQGRAR